MNGSGKDSAKKQTSQSTQPLARVKLADALRHLLNEKDFNSITTAEIAKTAGANEALIYRYFKDKRGLLHQVLVEYLEDFVGQMKLDIRGIKGAANKLRKIIWRTIWFYNNDRVFAKILLLEVRNFPGYFESQAYQMVVTYSRLILEILEEGVGDGEIRDDLTTRQMRQIILGGIEHLCLPALIFGRDLSTDKAAEALSEAVLDGILVR